MLFLICDVTFLAPQSLLKCGECGDGMTADELMVHSLKRHWPGETVEIESSVEEAADLNQPSTSHGSGVAPVVVQPPPAGREVGVLMPGVGFVLRPLPQALRCIGCHHVAFSAAAFLDHATGCIFAQVAAAYPVLQRQPPAADPPSSADSSIEIIEPPSVEYLGDIEMVDVSSDPEPGEPDNEAQSEASGGGGGVILFGAPEMFDEYIDEVSFALLLPLIDALRTPPQLMESSHGGDTTVDTSDDGSMTVRASGGAMFYLPSPQSLLCYGCHDVRHGTRTLKAHQRACPEAKALRRRDELELAAEAALEAVADVGVSLTPPDSEDEEDPEEEWGCGGHRDPGEDSSFDESPPRRVPAGEMSP